MSRMLLAARGLAAGIDSRWSERLTWLIVGLGSAVRIYQWALNRSFWLDEAYLAVNIVERDLAGLAQPLEYDQSAPYLFLAATHLLTSVFGQDERVFRFLPLVASVGALTLFWQLLRRLASPWVVPFVVGIFAFSPPLVFYAQELKQYAIEVLLVVIALYLLWRILHSSKSSPRGFWTLGWVGALGIFCSHTLPFTLAGVGVVLALSRWRGELKVTWTSLVAMGILWAVFFGFNYVSFIRPNYDNPFMRDFWAFAHAGPPWTSAGLHAWKELTSVFIGYIGFQRLAKLAFVAAILAGAVYTCRSRCQVAQAALLGLGAFGLAVMLGQAPFYGRLSLFVLPMLLILGAVGLSCLMESRLRLVACLLLGILTFTWVRQLPDRVQPIEVHDQRGALAFVDANRAAGEQVYVTEYVLPGMRFYRPRFADSPEVVAGIQAFHRPVAVRGDTGPGIGLPLIDTMVDDVERRIASRRFWIVTAHMDSSEAAFDAELRERLGVQRVTSFKRRGAGAVLYAKP